VLFRAATHCKGRLGRGLAGDVSSTVDMSVQSSKVGQLSASHWPGWRFPGHPSLLWQLRAQPFQGASDGSPIIVSHRS
jgi:hypothetical protein